MTDICVDNLNLSIVGYTLKINIKRVYSYPAYPIPQVIKTKAPLGIQEYADCIATLYPKSICNVSYKVSDVRLIYHVTNSAVSQA